MLVFAARWSLQFERRIPLDEVEFDKFTHQLAAFFDTHPAPWAVEILYEPGETVGHAIMSARMVKSLYPGVYISRIWAPERNVFAPLLLGVLGVDPPGENGDHLGSFTSKCASCGAEQLEVRPLRGELSKSEPGSI